MKIFGVGNGYVTLLAEEKFDGYIVRTLAYPNGSYNNRVIDAAKNTVLQGADWSCRCQYGGDLSKAPFEMYRVTVADDGNGLEGFKKRLEQAYFFGFCRPRALISILCATYLCGK